MTLPFHGNRRGFTRIELLCVVLAVVAVIASALLVQRHFGPTGKQSRCLANPKQIGLGFCIWMSEHYETPPWRKATEDGGHLDSQAFPHRGELWFQFAWISNELASPKILVDPAETDRRVRVANTWDAKGGFADPQFRDSACSYALALDFIRSGSGPIPMELAALGMLVSDRHLTGESKEEECSYSKMKATALTKPFRLHWSEQIHGPKGGNVGRTDGSVDFMNASNVAALLPANSEYLWSEPSSTAHLLFPRRTNSNDPR